jgi:hypothetical protein
MPTPTLTSLILQSEPESCASCVVGTHGQGTFTELSEILSSCRFFDAVISLLLEHGAARTIVAILIDEQQFNLP